MVGGLSNLVDFRESEWRIGLSFRSEGAQRHAGLLGDCLDLETAVFNDLVNFISEPSIDVFVIHTDNTIECFNICQVQNALISILQLLETGYIVFVWITN